ncbi:hypothetical protein [Dactylosporangium darangshiense]|uniref:hypothetical protein n=1 Tax=Dactylosporangium darangshiense TaxID=579108 RepID=UPI0031EF9CE3
MPGELGPEAATDRAASPARTASSVSRCELDVHNGDRTSSTTVPGSTGPSGASTYRIPAASAADPLRDRGRCQRSRSGANPASSSAAGPASSKPTSTRAASHAARQSPRLRASAHSATIHSGTA